MLALSYGTVSDIEITWTLIATLGLGFSLFNLIDAWRDRTAVIAARLTNGRRIIANFAVRAEAARTAIQAIFVLIGAMAMFIPDPPPGALHGFAEIDSIVTQSGLVLVALLIMVKSIDAYLVRHQLTT